MTRPRGYPIAGEALDLDLYRLLCVFAASGRIARLSQRHRRFEDLLDHFEPTEASQRLIAIAIMLRSILDAGTGFSIGRHDQDVVGQLFPDVKKPTRVVPLRFREACNKIIHADTVKFWSSPRRKPGALRTRIQLGGLRNDVEWRARIDIFPFIETASWLA